MHGPFAQFAHWQADAIGINLPLVIQNVGGWAAPIAKADDPVFQRQQWLSRSAAAYWIPALAGMTIRGVTNGLLRCARN